MIFEFYAIWKRGVSRVSMSHRTQKSCSYLLRTGLHQTRGALDCARCARFWNEEQILQCVCCSTWFPQTVQCSEWTGVGVQLREVRSIIWNWLERNKFSLSFNEFVPCSEFTRVWPLQHRAWFLNKEHVLQPLIGSFRYDLLDKRELYSMVQTTNRVSPIIHDEEGPLIIVKCPLSDQMKKIVH